MSWAAVGVGAVTLVSGLVSSNNAKKKAARAARRRPKYKISDEAKDNQALAKAQAYGRDRDVQMQEENISQSMANTAAAADQASSSSSALLSTLAQLDANKNSAFRGLAQDESAIRRQARGDLYAANQALIDEDDKAFDYNVNQPYQNQVAASREQQKYGNEMMMAGLTTSAGAYSDWYNSEDQQAKRAAKRAAKGK